MVYSINSFDDYFCFSLLLLRLELLSEDEEVLDFSSSTSFYLGYFGEIVFCSGGAILFSGFTKTLIYGTSLALVYDSFGEAMLDDFSEEYF